MAIITDGVRTKFTDDTGLPLIGGQVFSYVEGTSTPKDTYQDREFTIPNTNPIILDDVGSCQMYLNGGYRLRVLTADGVLVEEKDNAFQSDGQVLDVVANTTAIAALQTNVDVLNTRGGLKTDENNHIIGQGKAESATVYDLSLRSDKIRVSAPTDVEFGDLVFKTYAAPTVVNGVTVPKGTWLNPDLVNPLLGLGTAATKKVGTGIEEVPLVKNIASLTLEMAKGAGEGINGTLTNLNSFVTPSYRYISDNLSTVPFNTTRSVLSVRNIYSSRFEQKIESSDNFTLNTIYRYSSTGGTTWTDWRYFYHTANTTKDSNGFIKAASPIVQVYADKIEVNEDARNQNIGFKKNGIGDYTINTQSGLSTDGWYLELPKDLNGNPKVAVTLNEVDGVISLKSYKRIFSMETFTFVPDLNEPLDIPEGRWIDLRLNELPAEPTQQSTP